MPLVSEKEVLDLAKGKDFAVPGFFAFNYEFITIIIEVAEETEKLFSLQHVKRLRCTQRFR